MNFINSPNHNDTQTLQELQNSNYGHYANELARVLVAYQSYLAQSGQASAVGPINLTDPFKTKIQNLYSSSREAMQYISEIREAPDVSSCPMCGSSDVGTLDHIFPISIFPEFSIFSKNLVPACHGCNGKRGNIYSGPNGGRVLHPYFDNFLVDRLIFTELTGNYERPNLQVALCNPQHPNHGEILFHAQNVVMKTRIITKQIQIYLKLKKHPAHHLPGGVPSNVQQLSNGLDLAIQNYDNEFDSRNNWKSMLYTGIRNNPACQHFLVNKWNS